MAGLPHPARWSTGVTTIRLLGEDGRRFLHGQSSQAIALAEPGSCLATCLITATARLRALALVLVREAEVELVVLSGDGAAVHRALDAVLFPADQVRLESPQPATLARFSGEAGGAPAQAGVVWLQPGVDLGAGADQPALLLRPGSALPAWLAALPELSPEQAELQRIRQGMPAAPSEVNEHTNPFELGLAAWVSLSKGCYVGQETLAKLATYDGVKQQLRHWRSAASAAALAPGTGLTSTGGERAGLITSCLGTEEGSEGLALIRRSALAQATLEAPGAAVLHLARPPAFVDPPAAAGGPGRGQP
jgi:folate-binding protein YgfZ